MRQHKNKNIVWFTDLTKQSSTLTNPTLSLIDRAGLIVSLSSGAFFWSAHGIAMKHKVANYVRKHMNAIAAEVEAPNLVRTETFDKSGRSEAFKKELFKFEDECLAPTSEEMFAYMFKQVTEPTLVYQLGPKFRKEIRPRNLFIRAKSFWMKDAYSFDFNVEDAMQTYELVKNTYVEIFKGAGIDHLVYPSDPSAMCGGHSDEFFAPSELHESTIYRLNDGTYQDEPAVGAEAINGLEMGHVFYLGQHFTKTYRDDLYMSSYGIGIERLLFKIIENSTKDSNGMPVYPHQFAPYTIAVCIDELSQTLGLNVVDSLAKAGQVVLTQITKKPNKLVKSFELIGVPQILIVAQNQIKMINRTKGTTAQADAADVVGSASNFFSF